MAGRSLWKRAASGLFCALFALLLILTPALAAGEGAEDCCTVGVPVDRCPMFYLDGDTGEIVGIGVDLMEAAAQEAGFTVTFRAIEEGTLKAALDNPVYDLVMPFGSALTSAAGQPSLVSDNLFQTPFTLVTAGQGDLPPLNELRVGMLRSLAAGAETVGQLFPGIEISMYETMEDCVQALRSGQVDALLHNSYVWSYVLQKPAYSDLTVQPSAMFSMDFRAATLDTPQGRARMERLNQGIAALTDTRRQAVILDHTSRRLYQYDLSDYLHQYGLVGLLVVLLFAAVLIIALQRLRAQRLEQEEKLRRLMDHDPLTGAYSLNGFRKQVQALLEAHPETPYLLSYANIKNFKYINDSLGMAAGDELLRFWISETQKNLTDRDVICRIEADHIALLSRAVEDNSLRQVDAEVLDRVRTYFLDRGLESRVQICCGVYVLTPEDYRKPDVDHMLDYARVAEKRVRDSRRDGCEFYNPEQWERGKRVAEVVNFLPTALQSGDIRVWYQPQVDFGTGEITGAEALCRWDHAKLGWLHPSEFIATLEDSGLIYELDCYVWDRVCRDLRRWKDQGLTRSVSVNVSRCDIREDRSLADHFAGLLRTYGLDPQQLRVEITESAYVDNPALLIETTEGLRALGLQVEMDDFGSGYSSLHMLKEVPVDRIKLDLHFLSGAGDPEKGRIIVRYMIQMVQSLGMRMIAEGVETADQARFLRDQGSAEMQGYYFYKPMPVEQFEALLNPAAAT